MNKYLTLLLTFALIFGACTEDSADDYQPTTIPPVEDVVDSEFHVYLCFGQSNMEGNAAIEDIDKGWTNDRFKVMTVAAEDAEKLGREQGKWYKATPPLCRWNTGLTPVDYFGRTMVASLPQKIKVGAVVVAVGGIGIEGFDKDGYKAYYDGAEGWLKGIMDAYDGNPYAKMVEMAKKAQESGVIKGILLHQGETNNMQQDWLQKVEKIYNDLLSDLGLEAENVPLLAGEMLYGGYCQGHNTVIAKLPDVIKNAHIVSAEGCEGNEDGLHFTAAGYRELGKRYAATMLSLLEEPVEPTPQPRPRLHVDGRYLKDENGKIVNIHGFTQTYSPFFNNSQWNNYNVTACLNYNQNEIDALLAAGWKMDFVRLHMDPYWSDRLNCPHDDHEYRYEGHGCFDENRFRNALNSVFIPMAEYAISKGMYVVLRPPGVSPHVIAVGDDYFDFLMNVWDIVSSHPRIKGNDKIMFELANEPVDIIGQDGTQGNWSLSHFHSMNLFMQPIVDKIRENATNIIWVPGLGYQSQYSGFATYPIVGDDIGYAVHLYPGWMGSDGYNPDAGIYGDGGYVSFKDGWDKQVKPVADFAPIIITEMDWAPAEYNPNGHDLTWGTAKTGTAGGPGFGANYKKIVDESGNVSWLVFTTNGMMLSEINNPASRYYTFLRDPEAFPWPCYNWFIEYAEGGENPGGDKEPFYFPLTNAAVNPNIWDPGNPTGTFDEATKILITGEYGFGGWEFTPAKDMSDYKYLVLEYEHDAPAGWWDDAEGGYFLLRIFAGGYWSGMHTTYPLSKEERKMVVNLNQMYNNNSVKLSPNSIEIVGIWSPGGEPIVLNNAYITNTLE